MKETTLIKQALSTQSMIKQACFHPWVKFELAVVRGAATCI
jgi:hypothetical protein